MTDVVWNHTANNSTWIKDHPEATYNLVNSPHLVTAFLIDHEIAKFSAELSEPNHEFHFVHDEDRLNQLGDVLRQRLNVLNLEQYFQCDVLNQTRQFRTLLEYSSPSNAERPNLRLDPTYSKNMKFKRTVNLEDEVQRIKLAVKSGSVIFEDAVNNFQETMIWLNKVEYDNLQDDLDAAINNLKGKR